MAQLERIRVYPVKGFDGVEVDAADVLDGGTLAGDREFAFFEADGTVLNGKRSALVHELATDMDADSGAFVVETPTGETERFDLSSERQRAEAWFGDYFDADLTLRRDVDLGYVDRREMGPSVVSERTLEAIETWFDELTVDGVRRRLRANVEVSGVPAFWEDRFVGDDAPAFAVGDVRFEGVTSCGRCVVPGRDPDTGAVTPDFRATFVEKRRETFPEWADEDAFQHFFTAMLIASVPESDGGRRLRVGDPVAVIED
ncbi:MOSC domain-containing protein [Halobellus captivus]|uniref:MOSC domain-containing protein n=1 Tax=Halobellus captivus TaxID=2592614 RepID=UPI00119ED9EA|nr:MOSC N-terminal beta barrel domain-containing protein [Halobellus captivus]